MKSFRFVDLLFPHKLWRHFPLLVILVVASACAPVSQPPTSSPTTKAATGGVRAATISGIVTGGGDTTPQGLVDAPRTFVYVVKTDDGKSVNVQYTAYPPSPAGETQSARIRLNFHAGTVQVGDYMIAHGQYDPGTNMLVVAEEGDYIETYPKKP